MDNLYHKANATKSDMLKKLIETGKKFDPHEILKIYGDDEIKLMGQKIFNITEGNFNKERENGT
jgi:hypothetical protein